MRSLSAACTVLALVACRDEASVAVVDEADIGVGRAFYDPSAVKVAPEVPAAAVPVAPTPAPTTTDEVAESDDPLAKFGWTRDRDGFIQLTYLDLSLEGHDQELLVEKLLYPEEYADEELEWPERIRALDGEKVALTGYMIPLLWKDTTVPNFMLVRDLMSCCFGGAPRPDEWTDVKMKGEGAGYWSYVPVVTRGIFRLAGIADEAGYAAGAYSIEGQDVRREL